MLAICPPSPCAAMRLWYWVAPDLAPEPAVDRSMMSFICPPKAPYAPSVAVFFMFWTVAASYVNGLTPSSYPRCWPIRKLGSRRNWDCPVFSVFAACFVYFLTWPWPSVSPLMVLLQNYGHRIIPQPLNGFHYLGVGNPDCTLHQDVPVLVVQSLLALSDEKR